MFLLYYQVDSVLYLQYNGGVVSIHICSINVDICEGRDRVYLCGNKVRE